MSSRIHRKLVAINQQATKLALVEVERLARDILRKHPNLDEFVMAMGSGFFTVKRKPGKAKETISLDERRYFAPLHKLIEDWDSSLRLTGIPMRFTVDGPVCRNW